MEKKVVSIVSALVLVITIASSFLLMNFPNMHTMAVNKQTEYELSADSRKSVLSLLRGKNYDRDAKWAYDASVRLQLPDGVSEEDISYRVRPLDRVIELRIPGAGEDYFSQYPMLGDSSELAELTYYVDGGAGVIEFEFDEIREYQSIVEGQYVYLGFINPRDKYDHIVVIDAGHGGNIPGATRSFVTEKDVDLAIASYLYEELSQVDGLGVYMTRDDDSNPSFAERVGLANALNADLFISIHNNAMKSRVNNGVYGTEVLYKSQDNVSELESLDVFGQDRDVVLGFAGGSQSALKSKSKMSGKQVVNLSSDYADRILQDVAASFETKSIGTKQGDDLYLLRYSAVPTVLVEVGFLTNTDELVKLGDANYQKKAAHGMYKAIVDCLCTPE